MSRVTIFPEWGGYKIKVDGKTVAAAPGGMIETAKKHAIMQCKIIHETEYDILDDKKNVLETIKI